MTLTISLSEADVMTAMRAFLLAVLPAGVEIVQAQANNVPMPAGAFVAMNSTAARRLGTNVDTSIPVSASVAVMTATQYDVALDFYGPGASGMAMTVQAMFRDDAGVQLFPATVSPLHCDDPMQIPLVTGEQQWLERWRVSAAVQIDPVVSTTQQSATAVNVGVIDVTTAYPA